MIGVITRSAEIQQCLLGAVFIELFGSRVSDAESAVSCGCLLCFAGILGLLS